MPELPPYAPEFGVQMIELVRTGRTPEAVAEEFDLMVSMANQGRRCVASTARSSSAHGAASRDSAPSVNASMSEPRLPGRVGRSFRGLCGGAVMDAPATQAGRCRRAGTARRRR